MFKDSKNYFLHFKPERKTNENKYNRSYQLDNSIAPANLLVRYKALNARFLSRKKLIIFVIDFCDNIIINS